MSTTALNSIYNSFLSSIPKAQFTLELTDTSLAYTPNWSDVDKQYNTVQDLENSQAYKDWTDYAINNYGKDARLDNYFQSLSTNAGVNFINEDGSLNSDEFRRLRNDGKYGYVHLTPGTYTESNTLLTWWDKNRDYALNYFKENLKNHPEWRSHAATIGQLFLKNMNKDIKLWSPQDASALRTAMSKSGMRPVLYTGTITTTTNTYDMKGLKSQSVVQSKLGSKIQYAKRGEKMGDPIYVEPIEFPAVSTKADGTPIYSYAHGFVNNPYTGSRDTVIGIDGANVVLNGGIPMELHRSGYYTLEGESDRTNIDNLLKSRGILPKSIIDAIKDKVLNSPEGHKFGGNLNYLNYIK